MSFVPTSNQQLIDFCITHADIWNLDPEGVGLVESQISQMKSLSQAALASYNASNQARAASKFATVVMNNDISLMRTYLGDLIRTIRAYAELQGNPAAVYAQAQVPPPAVPGPVPAPAQPTLLTAILNATTGEITLRWKATQPDGASGTSYIVRRRQNAASEFAFIGVTGTKSFIDSTFFAGPDMVQYTVQAQRADASGPISEILTVNFGRVGPTLTITGTSLQAA